ncbi:MAG: hypothetical protein AB8D52_04735 [Gammaproteobacteria bacterium]
MITQESPFQIYHKDQINLIVSGVGKVSSANAIGYLCGHNNFDQRNIDKNNSIEQTDTWLNIGMAGHSHLEINTGFLANKIIDQATDKSWFPPIIFDQPCYTDKLTTVDKPCSEYKFGGGVDMEASAFFASASRYTTNELVHSYKVVSDNPDSRLHKITPAQASELISSKLEDIQFIADQLLIISNELSSTNLIQNNFETLTNKIRMTHSEKLKIKSCLTKLSLVNSDLILNPNEFTEISSSKEIISHLNKMINKQEIYF